MLPPSRQRADYADTEVAVVVSVAWAGRRWYLSDRVLTDGKWSAEPGLVEVPELSDEISLEPGGDAGVTVPIALCLPAERVQDYLDRGYDFADIGLEVAWVWHRDGQLVHAWGAREVRAEGYAIEAVHDDPEQPAGYLSCTLEDSPYRTARPVVPWSWYVGPETWIDAPEDVSDRYPLVLGRPDPEAVGGGPPAPVVDVSTHAGVSTNKLLIVSVGWCATRLVRVLDNQGNSALLGIDYQADALGQTCAVVDIIGSSLDDTLGTTYTTAWTKGPALAPYGRYSPLDLASYLLHLGGADLDGPEWSGLARLLELRMGGFIDDPETRAWEVARDMMTGLPVTMRRARNGWAPVLLDPYLGPRLVSHTWAEGGPYRRVSAWAGTGMDRVGQVEVSGDASEVRVGFTAERDAALPHAWVRHLPEQQEADVQSSWAWDASTRRRQASWAARIGALGWEAAAYQVPAGFGRAQAGDWIYLPEEKRYAVVQRRTLSGGVWDYTLARPRAR